MKNFHIPLPEDVHRRLREEAERIGRPATELAREAIDRWLAEVRKKKINEEIVRYAEASAGTRADLDPAMEKAGLEELRRIEGGRD